MISFFLWDGKSYGDSFITSRKINDSILSLAREGSILELHAYSVLKQNPPLIFLRSFEVVETVTYIVNTPLSLETLPKPITLLGFESYLSSVSMLFDSSVPSTSERESLTKGVDSSVNKRDSTVDRRDLLINKRESPTNRQVSSSSRRESIPSMEDSLSLKYQDKRMFVFKMTMRSSCVPPLSSDIRSMHPIGSYFVFLLN